MTIILRGPDILTVSPGRVTAARYMWLPNLLLSLNRMIVFNTLKKAEHYVKYKTAVRTQYEKTQRYYNDEEFWYYHVTDDKVLLISGWQCGCGCDRGHTHATVIGRIKSKV